MSNPRAEHAAIGPDEFLTVLETAYHQVKRMRRSIRMEDVLAEGLGLDSLAAIELLVALEQHYGVALVDTDEVARVRTVADLHRLVVELTAARAG